MKKQIFAFALTALVVGGSIVPSFADDNTIKDAIQSKAVDLAIEDSFSRYDWLDSVSAPNWWIQQDKELGNDADIRY
mgnify:CR=1 FL=1